jgi:hypothetical protein
MKVNHIFNLILISSLVTLLTSCASVQKDSQKSANQTRFSFTIEEAPEWTALFNRTSGWFGADGIFSIPLNGVYSPDDSDSTLFIFSDTMVGDIVDGKIEPGSRMVHNSVAYMQGVDSNKENISFYYDENEEYEAETIFNPTTPESEPGDYYWLGDGFVNKAMDNSIYIFAYRMRNLSSDDWSFIQAGNVLIKIPEGSRPPFHNHQQIETPFLYKGQSEPDNGSFGAGIFVNTKEAGTPNPDGYVYVYGVKGVEKNLIIARVKPEQFEQFDEWRFWDGMGWNTNKNSIAYVTDSVSNELSVTPLPDGRYALIFQVNGMSRWVGLRLGSTPYGPFGPVINLWKCSEPDQKNYIVYNAKAHPRLSKPGELIISYNVNAFDFFNEINKNPNLYRPRFIRLRF